MTTKVSKYAKRNNPVASIANELNSGKRVLNGSKLLQDFQEIDRQFREVFDKDVLKQPTELMSKLINAGKTNKVNELVIDNFLPNLTVRVQLHEINDEILIKGLSGAKRILSVELNDGKVLNLVIRPTMLAEVKDKTKYGSTIQLNGWDRAFIFFTKRAFNSSWNIFMNYLIVEGTFKSINSHNIQDWLAA
jgi:phosphoribosylformylglycinamidine (FGAM) synthase-like enzyme